MQNPAMTPFEAFIGEWRTIGTHPLVPGKTFHGRTAFRWLEGGAFIAMRSDIEEPEIPNGVAIFGSDNASGEYFMLYSDERGVSRKYDVSLGKNALSWRRDSPEISQRMVFTLADDGRTMTSRGEMSRNGGAWEPDLELTYSRLA